MGATITPQELHEKQKSSRVALIDVRTPAEFNEVHASGAECVPLGRVSADDISRICEGANADCAYIICKSGARAEQACRNLADCNAVVVQGGTDAWVAADLPVVRGKKVMSLERQVRIAAGSIVFIGIVLAWVVHPYFAGVSAFVGAGLVFAGVTDTCAMGMLIAKMPWNNPKISNAH